VNDSQEEEEEENIITKRAEICDGCDKKQFIICAECGCVIWDEVNVN